MMNTERNSADDNRILDAAASWCTRLDEGLDEAERREFERWIKQSPEHKRHFDQMAKTWGVLDDLDRLPIRALSHRKTLRKAPVFRGVFAGLAIAAIGLVAFLYYQDLRIPIQKPEAWHCASSDEFRRVDLVDGSVVTLNRGARVEVTYAQRQRRVSLGSGSAYFSVVKDAQRPFVVVAGLFSVEAVGTAFDVGFVQQGTLVTVHEGRVRVYEAKGEHHDSDRYLVAGDQILLSGNSGALKEAVCRKLADYELEEQTRWHVRLLSFDNATLGEVVELFNRHNSRRLVIADEELCTKKIGGRFRLDQPEVFLEMLAANGSVAVEKKENETLLTRRH